MLKWIPRSRSARRRMHRSTRSFAMRFYCPTADGSVVVLKHPARQLDVPRLQAASPPFPPVSSHPTRSVPVTLLDRRGTEVSDVLAGRSAIHPKASGMLRPSGSERPRSEDRGRRCRTGVRSRRELESPGPWLAPPLADMDASTLPVRLTADGELRCPGPKIRAPRCRLSIASPRRWGRLSTGRPGAQRMSYLPEEVAASRVPW